MVQVVIEVTEQEARSLQARALLEGVSVSDLLHRAVAIEAAPADARPPRVITDEMRRRARSIAGKFRSGLHDVARNHDKYIVEDILS
jgi:hypothetical protein